ncbi:MAG TPA: hypothetical protein VFH10_06605 [Nocardioides sp.]|uniref:hypothetical protein n=1 Tax=Nocardioides sp. TaxID=35761 RepID=UPI002D8017C0|nr:hypothetical protein [Nocardioides sp.]HET6652295.1 hypothetical protein [Nocardioides sp.]
MATTQARAVETDRVGAVGRRVVGGFYLSMGGVHLGIVAADPNTYAGFADAGLFGFVRQGWSQVFMADPALWGACLFVGETVLGIALLAGGRAARLGWYGVITFHVLLMLFGFWVWLWSLPAIAVLVVLARRDRRNLAPADPGALIAR